LAREWCFLLQASVHAATAQAPALDDKQRAVSAPDGRLLAAKSQRVRLPNASPNFRVRALSQPHRVRRLLAADVGQGALRVAEGRQPDALRSRQRVSLELWEASRNLPADFLRMLPPPQVEIAA